MRQLKLALVLSAMLACRGAVAQTFSAISFTGKTGAVLGSQPTASLVLSGTTLYGMTDAGGGSSNFGNVFSVGTNLTGFQNILTFTGSTGAALGAHPQGNVTLSGTTLFGMTSQGGTGSTFSYGNIFKIGVSGSGYENLLSFTNSTTSGRFPTGSLSLVGGSLYGLTPSGGSVGIGNGNFFNIGVDGSGYQNLLSFPSVANGGNTPFNSLTLSGSTFYATASSGGTSGHGAVFSIGADGSGYQTLVSFTGTTGVAPGDSPSGSLLLSGSTLYGMTRAFGAGGALNGTLFSVGTDGSSFQNLLSFTGTTGAAPGLDPSGGLILSGTTLYGMTQFGGSHHAGNIFGIGINGTGYHDLFDFTGGTDGSNPRGDLTLSGGTLFGLAIAGGASGNGTIFALAGVAATPEPGTLAIVGCGAAALLSYHWQRMRREGHGRLCQQIEANKIEKRA